MTEKTNIKIRKCRTEMTERINRKIKTGRLDMTEKSTLRKGRGEMIEK